MINMSAGQTMMSKSCLEEISKQMGTTIYYPPYWDLEEEVLVMLAELLETEANVFLMAGSATYGIEAGFRNLLKPGDKVVVVNGGVFGSVAASLLRIVGCEPLEIRVSYGAAVDLNAVARALKEPGVKALFAVHIETSTGTRFPISELGALVAARKGVYFLVDAISSVAGAQFKMDEWGVDLCFTSPQKCISGPQGVAIVGVSRRAWEAISARPEDDLNSLCLDMRAWKRYHDYNVKALNEAWRQGEKAPEVKRRSPHEISPSGPVVRGLYGALKDIFYEGPAHVRRRHQICSTALRRAADALGLRTVASNDELAAPVVTVIYLPDGIYERDFRAVLFEELGVVIANGEIGDDNVRIGTMGVGAQKSFVLQTVAALEKALEKFGYDFQPGAGVGAAETVFDAVEDVDWDRVPR